MFDGVHDHLHKFLASNSSSSSTPPRSIHHPLHHHPLTFSLYGPNSPHYAPFDHHHHHITPILPPPPQTPMIMHQHCKNVCVPWSNDEVLALLRIRSNLESNGSTCWFPQADLITWEHVSRKLGELGFKRSAENCKEKFEEESRYLSNISCSENYRLFGELEHFYHSDPHYHHNDHTNDEDQHHQDPRPSSHHHHRPDQNDNRDDDDNDLESEENEDYRNKIMEDDSRSDHHEKVAVENELEEEERKNHVLLRKRKRQRKKKFEMFKGLCENVVNKMMAHQEELHNKFLEDMVKREEEKIAREEAWKKQEMERIEKEIAIRAHEQALAFDRQAKIIEFLKKFTSSTSNDTNTDTNYDHDRDHNSQSQMCLANAEKRIHEDSRDPRHHDHTAKVQKPSTPSTPTSCNTIVVQFHQNPSHFPTQNSPNLPTSSNDENQASSSNPNSTTSAKDNPFSPCKSTEKPRGIDEEVGDQDGIGKRWPRDEVLALINIRCSLYKSSEDHRDDHKLDQGNGAASSSSKGPLWERISKKMMDLGYKRSSKRCKEKWENINKYFRKTKDMNKKRSLDSRTCPYFHQLSYLYNQGGIAASSENRLVLPEYQQEDGDDDHGSQDA